MADPRPVSALPSVRARLLAFLAIVVGGAAGASIGAAFVSLQCHGRCATPDAIGAVVGGLLGAGGVAVVAVLALRAMNEWRTIRRQQALEAAEPSAGQAAPASSPAVVEPD